MKMVIPSFRSWYRMAQKSRRETGSTPLVGASRKRIRGVQLILTAMPQTAVDHDAAALTAVLADLQTKNLLPEVMLADTAFGSDENVQTAATRSEEDTSEL